MQDISQSIFEFSPTHKSIEHSVNGFLSFFSQPKKAKAFPYISAGLALTPQIKQKEKDMPQAYLQYIAYDSAGNYLNSEYQLLDNEAKGNWQQLQLTYTAQEDGYVDVFVATERGQEVY